MSRFNDGNEVLRRLEAAKNGTAGSTGSASNAPAGMSDSDKQSVAELRNLISGRRPSGAGTGSHTATAPEATTPAASAPAASAPAASAPTSSAQVSQPSEQEQTSASVQNGSLLDRIPNMIKDKKAKAQEDKRASALPEIERRIDFYEKSPMGIMGTPAASDIGKGAAALPTSMQNKIVQGGDKVLSEKSEVVDKAVSDAEASRREIASAQRLMSDTIGIYGTKDENGAVVFQTQEGLNRYLAAKQRYNDAVQKYIDSTGAIYKSADEFSDAYQVYSDSMNALFQTFRDMPDSKIRGLAKVGNVAAKQYLMTYTKRGIVQRPLSYFTKNIDAAIADGNLERADELANWMVSQPWSAEDADAAVAYIDKTFNSSNLYSNGAKNVKGFAEASYIVDLADRSQWETLYTLMNSPEGDKYKEVIKSVYGIDCDSEESKRDNYLGLAEQLRPKIEAYISGDNKYQFDMLSQSAEYYKTQIANNRFISRAEDEITRASESATYRTQMDSYVRSQTAYYILDELSGRLGVEDNGVNTADILKTSTTQYLLDYLKNSCGVDLTGIDEANYRQMIRAAMAEQSKKARVMGDVLKRAGFDIDVVRQYSEFGVQYGYENVRQESLQNWVQNAKWYDWIGMNLISIPYNTVLKPLIAPIEMLSLIGDGSDVSDPNSYVPVVSAPSGVDMIRGATAQSIAEKTDLEIFGRNVASFLYTTAMSGLDSLGSRLSFGKFSVLFMGAGAASSEANNILARGGNRRQAFWGGLAAGAVEVATEYFSVDMFLKNCGTATGFKSFWEKAGEQFFTEGSEEAVGGVLDLVFDATNMGNLSESSQAVKEYMEQGLSYDDARIEVVYDNIGDILEESFSGGLSGAFSSGFSNIVRAFTNAKTINQRIDFYMSNDNVLSLYAKIAAGIQDGDSETAQRRKLRRWISNTEFGGLTEAELENARLHEQKRFAFETAKAAAKIAAQETEQRAALVQESNPEAKVLTSNGAQAYLDTGVVTLKVAQDAGEVLDGIVAGEITSDSISNNQIDKLKTTQPFGRTAVGKVLGVEVKRASSASAQRAAVREAIRTFEQNNAEAQSAVATAQNQAQQRETPLGMEFDAQNSIPVMMQQNALSGTGAPAMQQTVPATGGEAVGDAQTIPQPQASVVPTQENAAPDRPLESDTPVSGAMGFDEFRKQYAALNKNYGDEINSLYASYYDTIGSGKEMLTPSEFAEQYRAGKPKASNKEVARAYNEYVENNSVDDSEFADSTALNLDTEESTAYSVKDDSYGVERNEYSEKLDQKVVSAIDALAKLFHLKVRFGDLGGNNGLYHADTGLIELDIDPQHSGASNGFLFSVSHEIGHAVKERIGAKAWEEFADYAVKAKNGEKTIKAKQESAAEYAEYAVAREEVVCDFIGELLSEQKTLDTFCESIKGGEIKAETARGIVAAWRKITGILRGKGVKQIDTATAALVQRVQEQFGTDIETAENAVRKMQKALSAAMKVETQNNATETGDVKSSKKNNTSILYSKKDKPAVSAYTERYGTEIETQAQEDRARARSERQAQERMRQGQSAQGVQQTQTLLDDMIEESDAKTQLERERKMFTPTSKHEIDIMKMSKQQLAERVAELEKQLVEARKARRAYELVANKAQKEWLQTKGVKVDPTGVFTFVRDLMKKYESPSLANDVVREKTDELLAIFNKAAEINDKLGNGEEALLYVYYEGMEFAEDIVDSGVTYDVDGQYDTFYEQYSELLAYFRDTKLLLPRYLAPDVSPEFGPWAKRYYGKLKIKLVDDRTGNIDSVYEEISGQYPNFFSDQLMSEPDMLLHIADVVDKIYASKKPGLKYTRRYSVEERDSMKREILANIFTEYARTLENPRVKTKMDKIIERMQKALAKQKKDAEARRAKDVADAAEKAQTEQQVRDTKEMLRENERTAKRISDIHADYKKKIQRLLDASKRNEHRASMEAALNERDKAERTARKTERETDALIERLNREHFKQIYGLDRRTKTKIANLYQQMDAKVARLKRAALVAAVRNSKSGRDALRVMQEFRNYIGEDASDWTDAEIQTQILTAQEAAKAQKKPFKMKNALKKAGQKVYFETVSDTNTLERFSRLQNRADNLDTMVTLYRNSGANVETILTNHLIDPYGNVIDNRSLADVALMMKRGKAGRRVVDEDAQKLLNLYLYHKHGVDRMTIRDRAAKSLQKFIAAHPEYSSNTPGSLSMTEILLRAKDGDETAQEYIDLCKQFSKAKDKPVFGDTKGRPISAEMHRRIAADIEANHPEIVEKANEIYAWWDKFMQTWWVGTLGTDAQYKQMREMYPHYVPTFRVMEKGSSKSGYRNKTDVGQPIKAAKGSTRNLQPFEDGLASYVQSIISGYRLEGLFDNIANEIILGGEEADRFGEFVREWDGFKDGKNGTGIDWNAYMEADTEKTAEEMSKTQFVQKEDAVEWHGYLNGKPFAIEISPEMYRSIQSMVGDVGTGFGADLLRGFKKTGRRLSAPMKAMTTGASLTFPARNFVKDLQTALIYSKVGFRIVPHYFKAFSQMFGSKFGEFAVAVGKLNRLVKNGKQLTETDLEHISTLMKYGMRRMEKNARWQLFKDMGGRSSNYYRSDIGFVTNVKGDNLAVKGAKKIGSILSAFGEFTESLTRFAEFDAVLDKYGDTPENRVMALKSAVEVTVDFARHGRSGQYLSAWTPYLNAQIQGIDKFFREIGARKGKEKAKMLARASTVGLISPQLLTMLVICGAFGDDDEKDYRELSQRQRDAYYNIPLGDGKFLKIPKDRQYAQILGNVAERITLWVTSDNPDENLSDYFSDYWDTSVAPNFLPSVPIKDGIITGTLYDILINEDFAGRKIIPTKFENSDLPEYMKYDETCSAISVALGKLLNVSPFVIDYVIEDNMSDYGSMLVEATNSVTGGPSLGDQLLDLFERVFVADSAFSSQTVSDYYDMLDEISEKDAIAKETMSKEDYDNSFEKKVNSAISNYFGDDIAELNKKVKETTDEDEQRILKLQIREIAEQALDFYDRCMSGEIEEPVLYLKYEPYGDAVRNELIRLDGFTKGDDKYSFLPSDDAPNLKGHTNSEEEKAAYTDIYQRNYSKVFGDLICQSKYQNATDAEKADMLEEAREIVYFRSKQEWAIEYGISTDSYDPTEATNKYDTLMDAGISFFDVYAIDNKRKEIDAMEDVKLSVKESEFKTWLSKQPFTAEQKRIVQEEFGEWRSSQPVNSDNYDELVALRGWSNDDAKAVYHTIGALQPEPGKDSVSDWQKRNAIVEMNLPNNKKYDALRVMATSREGDVAKLDSAERAGISAKNCVRIWKSLASAKGHDLDGNGETDTNSVKNARVDLIQGYTYLTYEQKCVIWQWYYKDPDGWTKHYKEGKG